MTRRLSEFLAFWHCVPPATLVAMLALTLLFGFLLPGCWNPFSSDDDNHTHREPTLSLVPRTSPENVLYNLRSIYDGADAFVKTEEDGLHWASMYRTLFHPDSFKFHFLPEDVPPGFPEGWWGLDPEVASFNSMLQGVVSGRVDDISLSWKVHPSEPDPRPGHGGGMYVHVTDILLEVAHGGGGEGVFDGISDFYFLPDPADSSLWVVSEWVELPRGIGSPFGRTAHAAVAASWGRVKALFYLAY